MRLFTAAALSLVFSATLAIAAVHPAASAGPAAVMKAYADIASLSKAPTASTSRKRFLSKSFR